MKTEMNNELTTQIKTHLSPTRIADETYLIHDHSGEGVAPVMVPLNSLVIRGAEPVVVDTGFAANREHFFADVFSIVDPQDIRWLFISHDDVDHTGNVEELMDLAPNATLVINWFMWERMGSTLQVPLNRMRWIADGEHFVAGDRTLSAVRPPVYDSPTTRGLFDSKTGVYWASDAFATPMLELTNDVETIDPNFWAEGMAMFSQYVSPWCTLVDDTKFQRSVDRIANLGIQAIAGCHTPAIGAGHVDLAIAHTRRCASVVVPDEPGQETLDQILAGALMATAA